jgi:hypothetical protein
MASLNHNFSISERTIFLPGALDSSGKTGGGFLPIARRVGHTPRARRPWQRTFGDLVSVFSDPRGRRWPHLHVRTVLPLRVSIRRQSGFATSRTIAIAAFVSSPGDGPAERHLSVLKSSHALSRMITTTKPIISTA